MTLEPQKRRRSKKIVEAAKPEESIQESKESPVQKRKQGSFQRGEPDGPAPDDPVKKSGYLTSEEREERVSYVAWWLARNGFFATEVKLEIARKYDLNGKAAEEIIAAARARHDQWEQASIEGRRSLAEQWWISVVHGEDATLAQKMRAMECWQELHGLLRPAVEDKGPLTITIIEQVITDRSQIQREEATSSKGDPDRDRTLIPASVSEPPLEPLPIPEPIGERSEGVR